MLKNHAAALIEQDTRVVSVFDMKYFEEHGHHSKETPLTGLGSGDSALFLNILPDDLACNIFEAMDDEIDW